MFHFEAGKIPESADRLRADILRLRGEIFLANISRNVENLRFPLVSDMTEAFKDIPPVIIRQVVIPEEEQDRTPYLVRAWGGNLNRIRLMIYPDGAFADDDEVYDEQSDLHDLLGFYALVTRPEYRTLLDGYWQVREKASDLDGYIREHETDLLQSLKSDMERALGILDRTPGNAAGKGGSVQSG